MIFPIIETLAQVIWAIAVFIFIVLALQNSSRLDRLEKLLNLPGVARAVRVGKIKKALAERKPVKDDTLVEPDPPPRYDEVFWEGVAEMEAISGLRVEITTQSETPGRVEEAAPTCERCGKVPELMRCKLSGQYYAACECAHSAFWDTPKQAFASLQLHAAIKNK